MATKACTAVTVTVPYGAEKRTDKSVFFGFHRFKKQEPKLDKGEFVRFVKPGERGVIIGVHEWTLPLWRGGKFVNVVIRWRDGTKSIASSENVACVGK